MPEQIKVFSDILGALATTGILPNVILIGGWAQYLYRQYFEDPVELSALRTVDVDILFRGPPAIKVPLKWLNCSVVSLYGENDCRFDIPDHRCDKNKKY